MMATLRRSERRRRSDIPSLSGLPGSTRAGPRDLPDTTLKLVRCCPAMPWFDPWPGCKDQGRGRNTAQARGPSVESLITVLGDLPAPAVYVVAALLIFA